MVYTGIIMTVRMRHTRAHTANRRSHHALATQTLTPESGVMRMRHRASLTTGTYRGKKIIDTVKKLVKKQAKSKKK